MFFTLTNCLILSTILFAIGTFGVLVKRNILIILMSVELMLNAVNLAFIAFSYFKYNGVETGHFFVLTIIAVAAAEAAVGLAILISLFRTRDSADIDKMMEMKW